MMNPLVSIIVPVYKVEDYLPRCLDSLLGQSYQNLEILLVDDGSPDRSGAICDSYAERDARIRVIHQENGGVGRARNRALDEISGDFVSFADSDDWVEPGWIESLLGPFREEDDLDVSICGWYRHEEERVRCFGEHLPGKTIDGREAFRLAVRGTGFEGYLWNKMFRRDRLSGLRFREDITICEDLLFNAEVFLHSENIRCIPEPLYHYIIRSDSALRSYTGRRESEFTAREEMIRMVEDERELYEVAVFAYVQAAMNYVYRAQKYGTGQAAAKRAYQLAKPYMAPALLQSSVGLKARLRLFIMCLSPRGSVELWFVLKRIFGLEGYTKPGDR